MGSLLWTPTPERMQNANMAKFMAWLRDRSGPTLESYDDLWQWSVTDTEGFWRAVWDFYDVQAAPSGSRARR